MSQFILMLVVSLGYGQKQILFQEFDNLKRCQEAIKEISSTSAEIEKVVCLAR